MTVENNGMESHPWCVTIYLKQDARKIQDIDISNPQKLIDGYKHVAESHCKLGTLQFNSSSADGLIWCYFSDLKDATNFDQDNTRAYTANLSS